ncbi:hypothetical protein NMG60_11031596 [Bertholletia excelsa]
MPLRPLDNALPLAPERTKKPAKVIAPVQNQPDSGVNDENSVPIPPATTDAAIDYVSSENLKPFPDPDTKIKGLLEGLESKDWLRVCGSLNDARRFALYHSSHLLPILEKVMQVLLMATKSPRSALCKTSIMASADVFNAFGDKLLEGPTSGVFEQLLLQLLLKASQDKRFVCEEADRALNSMVGSMTPLPLLHRLRAYVTHANLRVRAKTAVSIFHCASKMDLEAMEEYGLVALVQVAGDLLNDRLPEAREAARGIVGSIYEKVTEKEDRKQEAWHAFCQSNLHASHAQSLVKVISSSQ